MKQTEHESQCLLIKWFDLQYKDLKGRLAAVPNAAKCPIYVGAKMNREGRRKGYLDLQLLMPRKGFHGLIIEMKTKSGRVSPEQLDFLKWHREQGYKAEVCRSFDEASEVISQYLS